VKAIGGRIAERQQQQEDVQDVRKIDAAGRALECPGLPERWIEGDQAGESPKPLDRAVRCSGSDEDRHDAEPDQPDQAPKAVPPGNRDASAPAAPTGHEGAVAPPACPTTGVGAEARRGRKQADEDAEARSSVIASCPTAGSD
jgi:hypothetical protein